MKIIETERLILRKWKEEDAAIYSGLHGAEVMEYLLHAPTFEEAHNFTIAANKSIENSGYGLFAAELKATGELMGFIGLNLIDWSKEYSFSPAVEIGWRLGFQYWGHGYATEGAKAALDYGFNQCNLEEIIAITVPDNKRSQNIMLKLGMMRDVNNDFDHPKVPDGHRLKRHVLFRIKRS